VESFTQAREEMKKPWYVLSICLLPNCVSQIRLVYLLPGKGNPSRRLPVWKTARYLPGIGKQEHKGQIGRLK
jgi:hypothetical protein